MKSFFGTLFFLSLFTGTALASFTDTMDIDKSHTALRLEDASLKMLPVRTEIRKIPGCRPGNATTDCTETVVLESTPAVEVSVSYLDGIFRDTDPRVRKEYLSFHFKPEVFSSSEIAELQSLSRRGRLAWAQRNLELQVSLVTRDVQVIDGRNSRFCPIDNEPYPRPGCVERIVYRAGKKTVKEVKVLVK